MSCSNPDIGKLISRYEFNLLSEEEKKIFEEHLLECDACFEDLYSMSKVIETMKNNSEFFITALEHSKRRRLVFLYDKFKIYIYESINNILNFISFKWTQHRTIMVGISISIFILLCSLIVWRVFLSKDRIETIKVTEVSKDTTIKPPMVITQVRYRDLAMIERLPFIPIVFKSGEKKSESDELFDEGMKLYNKLNYSSAIQKLQIVIKKDPRNVDAHLYLGICYLLKDSADKSIPPLKQIVKMDFPLLKEKAHWYLGNAYLLKEDKIKATYEFQKVIKYKGEYKDKAEKIIREINKSPFEGG
jgi:hypothetical protein